MGMYHTIGHGIWDTKETKWYSIDHNTWKNFIEYLATIKKESHELTEEERKYWDCYYIAKEHGKNENGCLQLPYKRYRIIVDNFKKEG